MSESEVEVKQISWPDPPTAEEISNMGDEELDTAIAKSNEIMMIKGSPTHSDTQHSPMGEVHRKSRERLFQKKYPDNRSKQEIWMTESMEEQKQRDADEQAERVTEAQKDMAILVDKYDWLRGHVTDDIKPFEARGLRQQRLLAQRDIKGLHPLLREDLRKFNAPFEKVEKLRNLVIADAENKLDERLLDEVNEVIKWVAKEHERKILAQGEQNGR